MHATSKQAANWMSSQVVAVTQQNVAVRTALDADVFLFDDFNQVRVLYQTETVTNPLSPHKNSIIKLSISSQATFTCMEVKVEVFTPSSLKLDLEL